MYWALFIAAFASATVVPGGSEVLMLGAIRNGGYSIFMLWAFATAGNTLGSSISWLLGRYARHWQHRRWFPISAAKLARAERQFNHGGRWLLLLTWVPVLGDALCIAAGVLRVPLPLFLLLTAFGKGFRYAVTIYLAMQIWP